MADSVNCILKAWELDETKEKETQKEYLTQGLNKASSCFEKWGLISSSLKEHMDEVKQLGALALKPTGSGEGGHVLSLWDSPPPLHKGFFPLFQKNLK